VLIRTEFRYFSFFRELKESFGGHRLGSSPGNNV
jgi:hypothetical protein